MLWSKSFETGIDVIDKEHQELFRRISILLDHKNQDRINQTLDFISQYVVIHFAHEEEMHLKYKYPKTFSHKTTHDNYVKTFQGIKEKFSEEGQTTATVLELYKSVTNWLKNHILVEDMDFSRYYKGLPDQTKQN